jgi:hypothetical protein
VAIAERVVPVAVACLIAPVACSKRAPRSTEGPTKEVSEEARTEDAPAASTPSMSSPPSTAGSSDTDAQQPEADREESSEAGIQRTEAGLSPVGCWERTFGSPPAPEALDPALARAIPDCSDCPRLHAGPMAAGLHPEVIRKLHTIAQKLPAPAIPEPVMWVNSGAREGPPSKSMHNQALAVDLVICGLNSPKTAAHLREAGFTCVIEYYDGDGNPCNVAHADLRGTKWAKGAYAPGGWKSTSCPERGVSKGEDCQNQRKEDWSYGSG